MKVWQIAGVIGTIVLAGTAGAQAVTPKGGQNGRHAEHAKLDLTVAEKAQLKDIRAKYKGQNEAAEGKVKADMAAWKEARQKKDQAGMTSARAQLDTDRQAHKALEEQRRSEVEGTLTPEQKTKFEEYRKDREARQDRRQERRKDNRQERRHDRRMDKKADKAGN